MALTKITGEGVGAVDSLTVGTSAGDAGASLTINKTPVAAHGNPFLQVGGSTFTSGGYYTIGLGFTNSTYTEPPAEISHISQSDSGGTKGAIVFGTRDVTTNTAVTERMRIDSKGDIGIGTSSITNTSGYRNIHIDSPTSGMIMRMYANGTHVGQIQSASDQLQFNAITSIPIIFKTNNTERMRLLSGGDLIFAHTTGDFTVASVGLIDGNTNHKYLYSAHTSTNSGEATLYLNRQSSDGELIQFRQANSLEGTISVSGTTVSYNGGHLSRWSRLADNSKDTSIVKGTVMTNLDQMVVWHHDAEAATYYEEGDELPDGVSVGDEKTPAVAAYDEDNEQLNCMAVSSVEGDANVAGVFVNWDEGDDFNDMNIAMTGDMVIRIAQGTTVARGDLLMSAGDGTAKPQGDDIVRSKTIAKVTSTTVSHTYDDGSYLVPCVLMAC